jgi:DNA-binding response OmpR family regulator
VRVLIIETDSALRRPLEEQLVREGMTVVAVADAPSGRAMLQAPPFDLVILDLMLPKGAGLEILAALGQAGSTAHVIVTSKAATEIDRVRALDLGADDYVTGPLFARELAARALAVRRRLEAAGPLHLHYDWLDIDLTARTVAVHGAPVELTTKEFDLLTYLASRPGQVQSREELLQGVWKSASAWQRSTTVTEHVRRVRAKLGEGAPARLLVAVRSIGYRFDAPTPECARAPVEGASQRPPDPSGVLLHIEGRIIHAGEKVRSELGLAAGEDLIAGKLLDLGRHPNLHHESDPRRTDDQGPSQQPAKFASPSQRSHPQPVTTGYGPRPGRRTAQTTPAAGHAPSRGSSTRSPRARQPR